MYDHFYNSIKAAVGNLKWAEELEARTSKDDRRRSGVRTKKETKSDSGAERIASELATPMSWTVSFPNASAEDEHIQARKEMHRDPEQEEDGNRSTSDHFA